MGDAHKRMKARTGGGTDGGPGDSGPAAYLQRARHMQQIAALIEGNADQRESFEAAPELFAARGVAPEAMRPADPTGKAGAHEALVIGPSAIHGDGLHAAGEISAGSKVCDVELGGKQTMPMSKLNTSNTPNATISNSGGKMQTVLTSAVKPGDEIVISYPHDHELSPEVMARAHENYPTS